MPGVLFVDDDPVFQAVVRRVFEQAGIPLMAVTDPAQALRIARDARPSLIILDYMMPGMDGLELFNALQKEEALRAIPVWMCSSRTDDEFISRTFEAGIADFVTKPVAVKAFDAKVKAFLRRAVPAPTTEVRQLRQELGDAGTNIRQMMGHAPHIPGLDVGVVYEPHSEIGGDFYDVFETPRGTHVVVIGDVSGHGVQAAVIQTMARKAIQLCVRSTPTLERGVFEANTEIKREIPPRSFVAGLALEWDPARRKFALWRFGAPHPLLRRAPARAGTPADILLSGGAVLGMSASEMLVHILTPMEISTAPGDVILLHTDGAVEAALPQAEEEFGFSGMREALGNAPETGAQAIAKSVADAVHRVAGTRLEDDLTLVALQVRPAGA